MTGNKFVFRNVRKRKWLTISNDNEGICVRNKDRILLKTYFPT